MKIQAVQSSLSGSIQAPGSKSHTIRALLLASLAEGTSHIRNPLPGEDCLSSGRAVRLFGAKVDLSNPEEWTVEGAGKDAHLPDDVVDAGNSGSLLYFMSPVAATFPGWTVFTGDKSIRTRPVLHVVDALRQLGAEAFVSRPESDAPPLILRGPVRAGKTVVTDGRLSQYISGIMMAACRLDGTTKIELTDPKETPFLNMTRLWLTSLGADVSVSDDYRHIAVTGPLRLKAFDRTIPSDWEAAAFPILAAVLTDSEITIQNVDYSGSQGDAAIVQTLQALGADITENVPANTLTVRGGRKSRTPFGRLSAERRAGGVFRANLSGFPDAVCALAAAACFTEGTVVIEDIGVCRRKETDRITVLREELGALGADITEGPDFLEIRGHAPLRADGSKNPEFRLHGGTAQSRGDHRIAMALACMGLALPAGESLTVCDAECCAVSFPHFFEAMRGIRAAFLQC